MFEDNVQLFSFVKLSFLNCIKEGKIEEPQKRSTLVIISSQNYSTLVGQVAYIHEPSVNGLQNF